jgi:arylsulfatase A-like enzyme
MKRLSRRSLLAGTAWAAPVAKPNILLLLADNWAAPHAGAMGDPVVKTPTFDRIAREGVLFRNAFAPNPSCSPSRSSLLTGQETHRLRDAANLYGSLSADLRTYPEILEQQGYHVGFTGKGWGPGSVEQGGRKQNPAGREYKSFEAFLAARPAGTPFCFWFGSHDPHVPWNRGQRAGMDTGQIRVPGHLPDHPAVREDIAGYYAEVQQFDTECGDLLAALGKEIAQTLVTITSDNGWQIPRGLANCYDLGVRIPMAIRYPARFSAGEKRDDFVAIADLAPTFLEVAGVPAAKGTTAQSLFNKRRRNEIFLERERHANVRRGDLSYPVRGIRTKEFLYLQNLTPDRWPAGDPEYYWAVGPYGDVDDSATKRMLLAEKPQPYFDLCFGKRPTEELYDLQSDPEQIHNVAAQDRYAATKSRLAARVEAWRKQTRDPRLTSAVDIWDRVPYIGPRREPR